MENAHIAASTVNSGLKKARTLGRGQQAGKGLPGSLIQFQGEGRDTGRGSWEGGRDVTRLFCVSSNDLESFVVPGLSGYHLPGQAGRDRSG